MLPFVLPVGRRISFQQQCVITFLVFDGVDIQKLPFVEQGLRQKALQRGW